MNFNRVDLVFEYHGIEFEWEGFDLESFRNDTSLSLYISPLHFANYKSYHIFLFSCVTACPIGKVNSSSSIISREHVYVLTPHPSY